MNKLYYRIFLAFIIVFMGMQSSFAQDKPEMADLMRSNGKIYVVVGCSLIILTGLFLYVWSVDRKISKAENKGLL